MIGVWFLNGTGPDGEPVRLAARNADVLRLEGDGTWRFVIDNPFELIESPSRPSASTLEVIRRTGITALIHQAPSVVERCRRRFAGSGVPVPRAPPPPVAQADGPG